MTGFTSPMLQRFNDSTQLLYCVMLALFGLYQATRSYVRCLRWASCFSPAIICLAAAVVFFGTTNAQAQDTTKPSIENFTFEDELTTTSHRFHNGITPFQLAVTFSEPVFALDGGALGRRVSAQGDVYYEICGTTIAVVGGGTKPTVTNFVQDPANPKRYTFDVIHNTETNTKTYVPFVASNSCQDAAGNRNVTDNFFQIRYRAPARPIANAGLDQTVASGETVTLDGRGSMDPDGRITTYFWVDAVDDNPTTPVDFQFASQRRGAIVTFTAPTVAPGAANVTLRYAVQVTDNHDQESDSTLSDAIVAITITPPSSNARPIANAGTDQTVASGATVTLEGSGTDNGGTIQDYYWVQSSTGTAPTLSANNVAGPTLTAPTLALGDSDVTFSYALRVRDNAGAVSDDDEVTITVKANLLPIANAGPDQTVVSGATVELDGSGSRDRDGDRSIAVYTWFTAAGNTPELKPNNNVAKPTLTAPTVNVGDPPVKFSYGLRVEDPDGGVSDPADIVEITVTAPDTTAPTGAFEAAQTTHDGMTPITITANFSEPVTGFVASDIATPIDLPVGFPDDTYGPTITNFAVDPNDATQYTFILTPRAPITINLRVEEKMDDDGYTDKAGNVGKSLFRQFRFSGSNWPPVVTTGNDRSVVSGTPVTLEGTGKDIDGTVASYSWARTGGTQGAMAPLTNANTAMASFTANTLEAGAADETHEFTLTVTDDDGATSTETVTITVTAPFVTTVAEAGDDQSVASGAMVELVGSGSKVDRRRTATYAWARTGGTTGGTATLTNANMKTASFTADTLVDGNSDVIHIFTLTVTDDLNVISTDTVTVKVLAPDSTDTTPPMAVFQNLPSTHDGETAFTVEVKFTEPVVGFGLDKIFGSLDGNPSNADEIGVLRTNFTPDPNDSTLYTITLTPRAKYSFRVLISGVITDASGNALAQVTQVLIRYAAPIAPPVAHAGGDQIVFSGETVTLDGSGTSDEDDLIEVYLWERTGGTSTARPMITDADKVQASFVADTLTAGASDVTHIIRLTVTDAAGNTDTDSATITVKEPFATPVANAGPDQLEVVSGATVQLDGSGSSVDRRRTATYSWARTDGTTGGMVTFSPSATVESPTFPADTLTESDSDVTHIFTLTVTDGEGGMATDMVTVTVKAPVPDTTGPKATTFRALGLAQNNHDGMTPINFEVVFDEPIGVESNGESTFTAEDINRAPWNVPADEDAATHTATISKFMKDPTNPLRYTFTLTPGVDSSGSGSELAFTVSIPQDKITDAIGNKNLNIRGPHLTYSAPSANTPPVAHAGDNQTVDPGVLVTLDGSGSMDKEGEVTYSWARTGGTTGATATLSNTEVAKPTFTADNVAPGTVNVVHIFTLTVTDEGDLEDDATVRVVIESPFLTTTANAGVDQEVVSGATVTLDGSASIVDGRIAIAQYSWARTGGTTGATATLSNTKVAKPTFTADTLAEGAANVTHIFTLTVTDNEDNTSVDTVTITVTAPFPALVANAGPDQPVEGDSVTLSGETVTLDGSGSTDVGTSGGRTVTYIWSQISGPIVTLSDQAAERPTFTAETLAPGASAVTYVFLLTVTDNKNSTAANDEVIIKVTAPPFPDLVAQAGPDQDNVASGTKVTLTGTGSTLTGSGRDVTYLWARTGGTQGGTVTLADDKTLAPSFTADTLNPGDDDVEHIITLTVMDNQGSTDATDTVTITVKAPGFPALVAQAGPDQDNVASGTKVTLTGTGSTLTGSGRDVTYLWARTGGTQGGTVTLADDKTLAPSFTADTLNPGDDDVEHIITLTVMDNQGSTDATDTVTITVKAPGFPALVAQAGPDQDNVASGTKVTLTGTGSTLTGSGRDVTYLWARTGGTQGGTVTLADDKTLAPSFTADTLNPGDDDVEHIITLTVMDNQGSTDATDTVTITVKAPGFPALVAQAGPDQDNVASGTKVTLTGTGSTLTGSGRDVTYLWARTGGTQGGTVTLADDKTLAPSFTADTLNPGDDDVEHIITLTVMDNQGSTDATDTVTITVKAPGFPALVARAGPDQPAVPSGMQNVQLDSTGSTMIGTSGGRTVTYAWTREQGSAGGTGSPVNLSDPAIARPTFDAPTLTVGATAVTYIFTLTVTDNRNSNAATAKVTITVLAPVTGQVADAGGDQMVASGATVTLDGRRSRVGKGPISEYSWTRESGTSTRTTVFTVQGGGVSAQRATTEPTTTFVADSVPVDGSAVTHVIALRVHDAEGTPSPKDTVTITVNPNLRPTANAGPDATYTLDSTNNTVSLDGSDSFDGTESDKTTNVNYSWVRSTGANRGTGGNVTLTGEDTATPTFTPTGVDSGAASVTYGFTLTVTDNESATHTDMVLITINAPPIALPGDPQTVPSGETIVLDGSGSLDGGARIVGGNGTYSWTRTGGTGDSTKTWTGENTAMLSVTPTDAVATQANAVTHIFTLTVTDSDGATHSDTVTLTVEEPIANPTAVIDGAAALEVRRGAGGSLVGNTMSTVDRRRSLSTSPYGWARTGGSGNASSLTLGSPGMAQTTFTTAAGTPLPGKNDETHEITLTVTDDEGDTGTALVTVSVMAPPRANAGPDQPAVASGATVQLDGSGSEVGSGRTLETYAWTRASGTAGGTGGTVTLSDLAAAQPTFRAPTLNSGDNSVNYIFTLMVTDNNGFASMADTVMITVVAPGALPNVAPVADAGDPQRLSTGGTGTLDGRGSMDDDGTFSYSWARTGGTTGATAPLTGATSAMPGFTVETPTAGGSDETHIFTLTVTDDDGATDEDTVTITVNAPPLANAGTPQTVASSAAVTLNGRGSDTTGPFRYAWTRSPAPDRGNAGNVTLTDADTAMATFTAVALDPGAPDAIYGFTLTVTDDDGATAVSMVKITVTSGLIAHAGNPRTVDSGAPVTLDGRGSTDIGTSGSKIVSYAWTRTGGTGSAVVLTGANTATPSFTAETLAPGATAVTYIFTLTVTDNQDSTEATATVTITVTAPPFAALVAQAGPDQDNVASGATVTLDGSGSTGSDSNRMVTYSWARTGGTAGGTVTLTDATTLAPSFTADTLTPGDDDVEHIITLTVSDNAGSTEATDTVTITVEAPSVVRIVNPAGPAAPGQLVTLESRVDVAPNVTVVYLWERVGGTGDPNVVLIGANTATLRFTADTAQASFVANTPEPDGPYVTHIFRLTVTVNGVMHESKEVTVIVSLAQEIVVSQSVLTVQEGGSGTYRVRLSRNPGQEVSVIAFSDNEDVVLENAQLKFNATNWNVWQEVRISTVADSDKDNDEARIRHRLVDAQGVVLGNLGDVRVTVTVLDAVDPILRPIGGYLETRATALLNTQPDLTHFLEQDGTIPGGSGNFTFRATNSRVALDGGFVRDGVWGQVTGSYASSDSGDVKSVLGSFGFHRKYSERFLAGAMLQFDLADHDLARQAGMIDGTGWLVGPYFAARNGKRPLYFEGRLLYGQSDNDIRFIDPGTGIGVRNGSFDTKRLLAQLRVQGEIALSDENGGPRLIPYADARWVEDRAATFTTVSATGLRKSVPGQKVSVGQLELGSNVEVPIAMSHGAMTFTGGLGLVYSNTEGDFIPSVSRSRGRGEIGLSYGLDDNVQIDFESFYDGIGTSGYEGYGLSLRAEMKF